MSHIREGDVLIDRATLLCLDDGWHAAVLIAEDGTSWPWLLAPANAYPGCCCIRCAPHETTGPLPEALAARIRTCGATTRRGTPCRHTATSGGRCRQHRPRTQ